MVRFYILLALCLLVATTVDASANALTTFAVIGDYGNNSVDEAAVAALVAGWNPDAIITVGDNNYEVGAAATIDDNVGQFYAPYIAPYTGSYGPGAATNQFWPAIGNHDWYSISCTGSSCTGPYFDYFTLPGNERYYDFVVGDVHFFALNSDSGEPDGVSDTSTQALWLQGALAAASEPWKIVYFHHTPYTSSTRPDITYMRWPFAAWGATAVIYGHDHFYERLQVDGIPYFVNGAGGRPLYAWGTPDPNSIVRYNNEHGAMKVTASPAALTLAFFNHTGTEIDSLTLNNSPTAVHLRPVSKATESVYVYLLFLLFAPVTFVIIRRHGVSAPKPAP